MQFDIDMQSEHRALFMSVQKLLIDRYQLKEIKKDQITTYSDAISGICHLRAMKHGIDIGFLKGVRMEDKYDLLTGTGKVMRILSIRTLDVDRARYCIDQAITLNAQKP